MADVSIEKLEQEAQEIILDDDFKTGLAFLQKTKKIFSENKDLKQVQPQLHEQIENLRDKISWISLNSLRKDDIFDLFKNHLKQTFEIEDFDAFEDVIRKLNVILLTYFLLEDRDDFKKSIRQAMLENQQEFLKKDKKIGDWLIDYLEAFGSEQIEKVRLMEYLTRISGKEELNANQREKLLKLFNLFEKLKISSFDLKGLEDKFVIERNGQLKVFDKGREILLTKKTINHHKKRLLEFKEKVFEKGEKETEKPVKIEKISLKQAVNNIIDGSQIELTKEDLKRRFENIIQTFFKGIRTEIETKIVLKRNKKIGGLGFSEEDSDRITKMLKKEKLKIDEESIKRAISLDKEKGKEALDQIKLVDKTEQIIRLGTKVKIPKKINKEQLPIQPQTQPQTQVPVESPLISNLISKENQPEEQKLPPIPVLKKEPKEDGNKFSLQNEIEKTLQQDKPLLKEKIEDKSNVSKITPEIKEEKVSIHRPISPVLSSQNIVKEVRSQPRALGPIEELQTITLADWKRWGKSEVAMERVKDKINLLAEESLVKKSEGIKAWKNSEINKLYLEIGTESIDQEKSVNQVIEQRKQQGKPTLTEEEFNAIVELNQNLRF